MDLMRPWKKLKRKFRGDNVAFVAKYFRSRDRKPLYRQLIEIVKCAARYKAVPYQYLRYHLYERRFSEAEVLRHVPGHVFTRRLQAKVNRRSEHYCFVPTNKIFFQQVMAWHGFRTAPPLLYTLGGTVFDARGSIISAQRGVEILRQAPYGRIFFKLETSSQGFDVHCIDRAESNGQMRWETGEPVDADFLDRLAGQGDFLFEGGVVQHPVLARFHPGSVNCFRVITQFVPRQGPKVLFALLKMGTQGRFRDNKGIYTAVNMETGELAPVAYSNTSETFTRHPDTGVVFAGEKVPFLGEVLSLCVRAAGVLPHVPSIGWDVTYSPDGPVIIEANSNWAPQLVQFTHGGMADVLAREWGIRY